MIKKTIVKKEEVKKTEEKILPIAKFRSGSLQVSIWSKEIETENGKFNDYNFNIERSYKDKEDEWKHTNSMRKRDIGSLQALLNKVSEYLLIDEDEETETTDE